MSRRKTKKSTAKARPVATEIDEDADPTPPPPESDDPFQPADLRLVPKCGWNGRLTQDEFFKFCKKYPQQRSVTYYVYRLDPIIDRTLTLGPDAESSIDKILGKPIDYNFLRNKWGSGTYQIRMKDTSFRPSQRQQVCDVIIDIDDHTEFPPILDYRELVDKKKNASYIAGLIGKKLMYRDDEGVLRVTQKGNPANTDGSGEIASRLLDHLDKAYNRTGSKIEEQAGVSAIQTMSSAFSSMLSEVMKHATGNGKENGGVLTAVMGMMQMQQNLMLKMFETQLANAKEQGNPGSKGAIRELIAEFKALFEAAEALGFSRSSDDKPWWQGLLTALGPGLFKFLQQNGAIPANVRIPETVPALPAAPSAPSSRAASTAAAGAAVASATVETAAAGETPLVVPTGQLTREELFVFAKDVLKHLQRGITGAKSAEYLDGMYDFATYWRIRTAIKNGNVLEQMQQEPTLIGTFAPYLDQLETFMQEFVAYGNNEDEDRTTAVTEQSGTPIDATAAAAS